MNPNQKPIGEYIWPGSRISNQDIIFQESQSILCIAFPQQGGRPQLPGQTCTMEKKHPTIWHRLWSHALVWFRREFIFFIVACMVLCFGFNIKTVPSPPNPRDFQLSFALLILFRDTAGDSTGNVWGGWASGSVMLSCLLGLNHNIQELLGGQVSLLLESHCVSLRCKTPDDGELQQGRELQPQHSLLLQEVATLALGTPESQIEPGRIGAPQDIIRMARATPPWPGAGQPCAKTFLSVSYCYRPLCVFCLLNRYISRLWSH